jgi:CDP-diacylglycerol--glycerol-3-phosphate 3-phosphatidyltransferase
VLNWPNLLTAFRMLCAPFFLFFLLAASPAEHTVALGIFGAAIVSDTLDGYLARKLDCVTDLGKFLDPLADKVIVVAALVSFAGISLVPLWMVLVIVGRELIIMGFRAVAAARGIHIYATTLAKWKTAFQMAAIATILCHPVSRYWLGGRWPAALDAVFRAAITIMLWVAVILTLVTGGRYLWKNRQVLSGVFVR